MKEYGSIIVVGSSASGKTSLVNEFRKRKEKYIVPMRYITRSARYNNNFVENSHISKQSFKNAVKNGTIDIYWSRLLTKGYEYYGFERIDNSKSKVTVY